jgi:DNA-3-methyladenine glycosylase II
MKFSLSALPPYDFTLSTAIFSAGDKQIRKFQDGIFWQVIRLPQKLVLIQVTSSGSVERPQLKVELISDRQISLDDKRTAQRIVSSMLNLNLDLRSFYRIASGDTVMAEIVQRLRGLKSPLTPTPFEALIESIIEQQISLIVAHSLQIKVVKSFGDSLNVRGRTYYAFPTPLALGSASTEQLRQCGLSLKKAEYVRDISSLISQGKLDLAKYESYDDARAVIQELDKLRGIGVWTAEMTLIRGMGRLDTFPADDVGLRRVISHYYLNNRKILSEEARDIAVRWGRWKALASFYLIIALLNDIHLESVITGDQTAVSYPGLYETNRQ